MRVKYRCQVKSQVRLLFCFPVKADFFTFEFETDSNGQLTHISAIAPVSDRSMWPTVKPSTSLGIAIDIDMKSPFRELARKDIRTAEGLLSLIGMRAIDFENAEESWLPDSPQEESELQLYSASSNTIEEPVSEWTFTSFDLVARAFLAASKGREIETALNFFRKGRLDIIEFRYLEAVYDFLFMIESLYAQGKFKSAQVEDQYLKSSELQRLISETVEDMTLRQNVARDSRILDAFLRDYQGKDSENITRHLVKLRGFLHHHTASRADIWHPEDHLRYGADAYFLQHLCLEIGFQISDPIWFAEEHAEKYRRQAIQAAADGVIPPIKGTSQETPDN